MFHVVEMQCAGGGGGSSWRSRRFNCPAMDRLQNEKEVAHIGIELIIITEVSGAKSPAPFAKADGLCSPCLCILLSHDSELHKQMFGAGRVCLHLWGGETIDLNTQRSMGRETFCKQSLEQ